VIDERPAKIGAALDRSLASNPGKLAQGEDVEKELDRFIAHRHKQRGKNEGERAEEAWLAYEKARRRAAGSLEAIVGASQRMKTSPSYVA
jgi:hypothetical protein